MSTKPLIIAAALAATLATPLQAAPRAERFLLGQSAMSGAVCEAVRDDLDAAAQTRGARAWVVRCRGWDTPLGRLYVYEHKGADALAPTGLYGTALASRARCAAPKEETLDGLKRVTRAACELTSAKVSYVAYQGERGRLAVAAEGFAQIADVLEAGLKIASGAEEAPKEATRRLAGASNVAQDFGGQLASLAQAADAASSAPENLRERAYSRNTEWRFDAAETDFRALAQNPRSASRARSEAYLNWALNASNVRRFEAANALFAQAEALAKTAQDPALDAMALNYRALHLRNQRQFKEAVEAAEAAHAKLAGLAKAGSGGPRALTIAEENGALAIGSDLAAALNRRSGAGVLRANRLDETSRLRVQMAQALHTAATAKAALGRLAGARASLDQASAILTDPVLSRSAGWLTAQVEAELARLDLRSRSFDVATSRLEQALFTMRSQQAGTQAEAFLLVELARAEAMAGKRAAAMQHFREGFSLFKETRGSLGASGDSAGAYFDLLLSEPATGGSAATERANLFFIAAEGVTSEGTGDTVARLAARLSQGDPTSAGLARALEDTRRQIQLRTSEIARIQGTDEQSQAAKAGAEVELKSLAAQAQELEQQLVAANPRYGQLVTSEASLSQLQSKLRPGEIYLKTVLLEGQGYGVAITRDSATPYAIKLTEAEARKQVNLLRQPFVAEGRLPRYDVAASYALFEALFGPVKEQVLAAKHIIYEPDSSMISLPVAALAVDQASVQLIANRREAIRARGEGVLTYQGVNWLGAKAQTSLVVSASSFLQSRDFAPSKARRTFIGFGGAIQPASSDEKAFRSVLDWGGRGEADLDLCRDTRTALLGLKPLNEAAQEVSAVARALNVGAEGSVNGAVFTDVSVRSRRDLSDYRVVYFATHGLLPQQGGCLPEPALVTSVGDGDSDALLDTSEILSMNLDADLVVLSACDTGGGASGEATGLDGGGEALSGLARAFIYAGARGLVVSHWKVDSGATVQLMTGMFRSGAASQAEALRLASAAMMSSPDQHSHPYYWAAFTVVGDGARAMPQPQGPMQTAAGDPALQGS
jgi:CHAT domain-containing protein